MSRLRTSPRILFAVAVTLCLIPLALFAAQKRERTDLTVLQAKAGAANCTFDPQVHGERDRRLVWRQMSELAERVTRQRPVRHTPPPVTYPKIQNLIDEEIIEKMQKDGIKPAAIASDEEFLRRVTLDLTGEIPDAATVRSFTADTAADKREKLVDQLLASEAFIDRWTMWFGDLVQNVAFATNVLEYPQGRNAYYTFIRDSIRANKPYDQMVREIIAGAGDNFAKGEANYVVRQIQPDGPPQDTYDNLSAHSGERFLGLPLLCLSCHGGGGHLELVNLYLATRTRTDFWRNAAFFARIQARPERDVANPNIRKFLVSDRAQGAYMLNTIDGNKTPRQPSGGQSTSVTPAFILTGEEPRPGEPYREAYGRMLTAHPQFARNAVNLLWKELFTLPIVDPIDSFDLLRLEEQGLPVGATVQPTHPDLLKRLSDYFVASGFDLRATLKLMATSSSYQLSARYDGTWNEAWTPYFARHYPHRLPAEMLLDAVFKATSLNPTMRVSGDLPPVRKTMQFPDTLESQDRRVALFLNEFGRGNRDTVPRTEEGSITQALGLLNDTLVTSRVKRSTAGSTVQKTLAATNDPATIVETLYLSTLSRKPTPEESAAAVAMLKSGDLVTNSEDLHFVLLNKLEFLFN